MRRLTSILLLSICMTSCSLGWFGSTYPEIESDEVSRVIITYSEKMRYERNLELEDSVIAYETDINRIRIDYSCMDALGVWDARALLVDTVEGLLGRINSNQKIIANLSHSEMTAENLEIYIRFDSFYVQYIDLTSVGLICLKDGLVTYFAQDALNCEVDCWHSRTESYNQSKNFIASKRQGDALYKPEKGQDELSATFGKERFIPLEASHPK